MTQFARSVRAAIALTACVAAVPASAQYPQYPYPQPRPGGLADQMTRGAAEAAAAVRGVMDAVDGVNYNSPDRYAVNACRNEASRYGSVSIGDVRPKGRDKTEVRGIVDAREFDGRAHGYRYGYERLTFTCTMRFDGRITKFKTKRLRY